MISSKDLAKNATIGSFVWNLTRELFKVLSQIISTWFSTGDLILSIVSTLLAKSYTYIYFVYKINHVKLDYFLCLTIKTG